MPNFGGAELLIILVIVLLIFGVGRIARVGRELGTGIREFRKGISGDEQPKDTTTDTAKKES
ncbi:MAG TPA: twin-arginine translocase TatA/TatE family subunit [Anaerolineae bacterium]|nr:twin-arginine translocase TatA/TatE family subunit [Anaerolineae bacterium]